MSHWSYDAASQLVCETPRAGIASVPNALGYDAAGNRKSTSLGQTLVEEDPGPSVTYGGSWSVDADTRATASEHRRAESNGSWVEFRFDGDAAALTYAALPDGDGGRLRATLDPGTPDEQALGVVDQCRATSAWQTVKTWTGLGEGAHVLRLTREEASCGASTSARPNVDAFRGYSR